MIPLMKHAICALLAAAACFCPVTWGDTLVIPDGSTISRALLPKSEFEGQVNANLAARRVEKHTIRRTIYRSFHNGMILLVTLNKK